MHWLGGLVSYGPDTVEIYRHAADFSKRDEIDDSYTLSCATEAAFDFSVRRRGPFRSLHENRACGPQNSGLAVQNDFCNSIRIKQTWSGCRG
jgi:hypothetical protein